MIILLSGQIKNIGDFLITDRAKSLFEEFVDKDVVILDRTKDLSDQLDLINKSRFVVLCGGPAYASNIYKGIYPLVDDLSLIKVPIIPFGLGWCGRPAGSPLSFSFNEESDSFLRKVHNEIKSSSCRCNVTEKVLKNNGFDNVTMTGCPVWYHLPSIGKKFNKIETVKHVVFTTAADPKLIKQTVSLIKVISKQFPEAKITMTYHRGIFPDKHTTIRATMGYLAMALGAKFVDSKISIKDVAYDLKKLNFYDDCDFHIGYRVHAHLYFLSKRLPSLLINEDGRGKGMVETMNLPVFNIEDMDIISRVDNTLAEYKENNFSSFSEIGNYIDNQFIIMKNFLTNL
ncbi:polysaccharide pyruvyl transferase family protein [Hyunsoonleella flava]|uniref:Polysaccharide pyruvyl transferase family protein n=1 Tax=Hyunsoonleella flava TaxID=2527939 RepID=A0A4Q9FAQ1_9FLAO|nr:polysaccharide pyruvyl transferase family protein [Hyunsoonleella flava]TBN00185.1 polysaccharide pyruvyl transferase family protein [Hyunsoonleella flava]